MFIPNDITIASMDASHTNMAVEQLTSWQHDIVERLAWSADSIVDEYIVSFPDTPDEIVAMRNNVFKLRALVQHSIADGNRAERLMELLRIHQKYFYSDLCEYGPKGKTGKLLSFGRVGIVKLRALYTCGNCVFIFFHRKTIDSIQVDLRGS